MLEALLVRDTEIFFYCSVYDIKFHIARINIAKTCRSRRNGRGRLEILLTRVLEMKEKVDAYNFLTSQYDLPSSISPCHKWNCESWRHSCLLREF
jgi:hypothetical protein